MTIPASILDRITLVTGDITRLEVDAIVNAANRSLLGGSGVDGAIHEAAGPGLLAECRTLGDCKTGEAKTSGGHDLPAHQVIHTVGPIFRSLERDAPRLASCYRASLEQATKHGAKSVAFPGISTGAYRFPLDVACRVAFATVVEYLAVHEEIEKVVFCQFGERAERLYEEEMAAWRSGARG